jgi:O-methyltransferase involved in polyketide biosynthesis
VKFDSLRHCHQARLQGKLGDVDPELPRSVRAMFDYAAVRTVFFDDLFTAAAATGIRQAVILGSGLDARAWRLHLPQALRRAGHDLASPIAWSAEGSND